MSTPTLRDRMVAFADSPQGASSADFQAAFFLSQLNANGHIQGLEYKSRLHRAKAPGQRLRFFARAADRDRWLAAQPAVSPKAAARAKPKAHKAGRGIQLQPTTPGVRIDRTDLERRGDLVFTERTKYTACPSIGCDPRYQAPAGADVPRVIATDGEPVSAWAAAVIARAA